MTGRILKPGAPGTATISLSGHSLCTLTLLAALSVQSCAADPASQYSDRVGDVYEIRLQSESEQTGNGSSGSSRTRMALNERVIELREDGVVLEFDLPHEMPAEDRAREWQFPAQVFKSSGGSLELVNSAQLETRMHAWLERGGLDQTACGRWVFTWTAVKIECDPQSVLQMLEPFDIRRSDLHDGALHSEIGAMDPAPLRAVSVNPDGSVFVAEMDVDTDAVRRQRAEVDVAVAEMMGEQPLTLEAALQARSSERISGTISTTFETDALGRVTRRIRDTRIDIIEVDGSLHRETTTETVERRPIASADHEKN